jgi:hypothetical protein
MKSKMAGAALATALALVALVSPRIGGASPDRSGAAPARMSLPGDAAGSARFPLALHYCCARPGTVSLAICTPDGWPVRSLVDRAPVAGECQAVWDGLDDQGQKVRGSAYLAVLRVNGRIVTQPFVLSPSCWKPGREGGSAQVAMAH